MRLRRWVSVASACAISLTLAASGLALTALVVPSAAGAQTAALTATSAGSGAGFAPGAGLAWASDADRARELDFVASTGASWLRLDFDWSSIERTRGTFNWSVIDRAVNEALARNLTVLALPTYTPAWARPAGTTDKAPPTDPANYARFVAEAARHFGARVKVWEIWNEPNIAPFWQPRPDAAAYTRLLQAAYPAIKAVDPAATVISGGLSPATDAGDGSQISPLTFLRRLYTAGGGASLDAVGMHPYSYPARPMDPTTASWNTFYRLPLVHDLMTEFGDGAKRIWSTEFGAPTGSSSQAVTEATQAQILAEAYDAITQWSWAGPLLWYAPRDAGIDPSDREQNFGLLRRDFTPKLAAEAFRSRFAATPTAAAPAPTPTTTVLPTSTTVPTTTTGTTTPGRSRRVVRISGADRVATAVALSVEQFGEDGAGGVVLARADAFPDALAAAPLARRANAPVLLTGGASLDPRVEAELQRVLPSGGKVHLVGGSSALSSAVEDSVRRLGYETIRYAGADRFATAVDVAERGLGSPNTIFLATGADFPDALGGGAAAAARGGAVLLTNGARPDAMTSAYLARHPGAAVHALGGPAAAAYPLATPVVGPDRYATSTRVAELFFPAPPTVYVASGASFPDALAAAPAAAADAAPLVLTRPDVLPANVGDYLDRTATIASGIVSGGAAAVTEPVIDSLEVAIA